MNEIPAIATAIFNDNLPKAQHYHELLAGPGNERGFIGPREIPRLWERHILNCAVIGEAITGTTVADIGSGAGLPGIPLAIARPDLTITLVEPLLKRSTFLNEAITELQLPNVSVLRGRAEEKQIREAIGTVDVVTSRAVAPLEKLVGWCMPLVNKQGNMLAMKGASAQEEINTATKAIKKAGGGKPSIITVGKALPQPTTLVRIPKQSQRR